MFFQAPMSDEQRSTLTVVVAAVGRGNFDELRTELHARSKGPWLPPPLLTVAAALIGIIGDARGREGPWRVEESVWDDYLPERKPVGRSEWRNANYALHAAGCLAAGIWLDVGRQESFWSLPLWPFALDVVELLATVAGTAPSSLSTDALQARLLEKLPPVPLS